MNPLSIPQTLREAVMQAMDHMCPETQDKPMLNLLTCGQILHSTWRVGQTYRDTTDANLLVPRRIYDLSTNKAFRFPPMIRAEFDIEALPTDVPFLDVDMRFATPRYLNYAEPKKDRSIRIRSRSTLNPPGTFGDITVNGDNGPVDCHLYNENSNKYDQLSYSAAIHRESLRVDIRAGGRSSHKFKIQEHFVILRTYTPAQGVRDAAAHQPIDVGLPMPANTECGMIVAHRPSVAAEIVVEITSQRDGRYHIVISLHNDQTYTDTKLREWVWRPQVILMPTAFLRVGQAVICMRPQQHADVLKERLSSAQSTAAADPLYDLDSEKWLEEYSHTNGVLARSTKTGYEADTLVLAPFGIYDTVRVDAVIGGGLESNSLGQASIDLLGSLELLTEAERTWLVDHPTVLDRIHKVLRGVMRAYGKNGGLLGQLRLYQWHAIQKRIQQLIAILSDAPDARRPVRVIRAPTAAGKTLVFMANAALHVALTGERAVLAFPTRILNEDMFKRLTRLVYFLRAELPDANYRGGLLIGQSDPLFRALTKPKPNQPMVQFGACPNCPSDSVVASLRGGRTVGTCPQCGHVIDYMYDPNETGAYLPNMVIATPDKLFFQATAAKFEQHSLRFFGARCVPCECGQHVAITPKSGDRVRCGESEKYVPGCGREVSVADAISSPIGYWVFDEVHSVHGLTATLLSGMLDLLYYMGRVLGDTLLVPVYETGTATIANERALLEAITRRPAEAIEGFPSDQEYLTYFQLNPERVRYRTLVLLPVGKSSLMATAYGLLYQYEGFHGGGRPLRSQLNQEVPGSAESYSFILGYLFRKRDIYNLRHTLTELFNQVHLGSGRIEGLEMLSGDSEPGHVSRIMQAALDGRLSMLLANLVVSLGVDIAGLNNLMMFGFPGSVTEYVQTAGRTGRGELPGHVTIYLNPARPRDMYLWRYFYQMLGDISGYYESKPAAAAGVYAASIMMPNVVKGLIAADYLRRRQWTQSRNVAGDLANTERRKRLLTTAWSVLAGNRKQDAVGRKIAEDLKDCLRRWTAEWGRDSGFLSTWFQNQEILLTSLRELSQKTVELNIGDNLYVAMNDGWLEPDSMGSDDAADDIDESSDDSTSASA